MKSKSFLRHLVPHSAFGWAAFLIPTIATLGTGVAWGTAGAGASLFKGAAPLAKAATTVSSLEGAATTVSSLEGGAETRALEKATAPLAKKGAASAGGGGGGGGAAPLAKKGAYGGAASAGGGGGGGGAAPLARTEPPLSKLAGMKLSKRPDSHPLGGLITEHQRALLAPGDAWQQIFAPDYDHEQLFRGYQLGRAAIEEKKTEIMRWMVEGGLRNKSSLQPESDMDHFMENVLPKLHILKFHGAVEFNDSLDEVVSSLHSLSILRRMQSINGVGLSAEGVAPLDSTYLSHLRVLFQQMSQLKKDNSTGLVYRQFLERFDIFFERYAGLSPSRPLSTSTIMEYMSASTEQDRRNFMSYLSTVDARDLGKKSFANVQWVVKPKK